MLNDTTRRKLVATMRLLGSPVDGEALGAARALIRLLEGAEEVVITPPLFAMLQAAGATQSPPPRPHAPPCDGIPDPERQPIACARVILEHPGFGVLGDKSRAFVQRMASGWSGEVSDRQTQWLSDIVVKVVTGSTAPPRAHRERAHARA